MWPYYIIIMRTLWDIGGKPLGIAHISRLTCMVQNFQFLKGETWGILGFAIVGKCNYPQHKYYCFLQLQFRKRYSRVFLSKRGWKTWPKRQRAHSSIKISINLENSARSHVISRTIPKSSRGTWACNKKKKRALCHEKPTTSTKV